MKKRELTLFIAHVLAIIAITLSVLAIIFYFPNGHVMNTIFQPPYISTVSFRTKLSENINNIFNLFELERFFCTDGELDENKLIVSCTNTDTKHTEKYTIPDLLKISRQYGYSIDKDFNVHRTFVSDTQNIDFVPRNVLYRSYHIGKFNSKSVVSMTLSQICSEFLDYLAKYYKYKSIYKDSPSNLNYIISYSYKLSSIESTNNKKLSFENILHSELHYCISSSPKTINCSIPDYQSNALLLLSEKNPFSTDNDNTTYYFALKVDPAFKANDEFRKEFVSYNQNFVLARILYLIFMSGIFGFLSSFILIILHFIKKKKKHIKTNSLVNFIPTENIIIIAIPILILLLVFIKIYPPKVLQLLLGFENSKVIIKVLSLSVTYLTVFICVYFIIIQKSNGVSNHSQYFSKIFDSIKIFTRDLCNFSHPIRYYSMLVIPLIFVFIIDISIFKAFLHSNNVWVMLIAFLLFICVVIILLYIYTLTKSLISANENKAKADHLKTALITNVSHDIKTPLTSIINYSDILSKEIEYHSDQFSENAKKYAKIILDKSDKLKFLIDDLIEASKATTGNVKLELSNIDFIEMCEQILGEYEDRLKENNLTLIKNIKCEKAIITVDANKLFRILENLLSNIIKYAQKNSRVYVEIYEKSKKIFFEIKNISAYPLNLSPEELSERFTRGDANRSTSGYGLGIPIAKSLTQIMGGTFDIVIDADLFKIIMSFDIIQNET